MKNQNEIWFVISSIGISIIIIDFLRRLFFISVQPWWTQASYTTLEDASPIWLSATLTFLFIYLFLVKKISKVYISFLVWLSCGFVISIPTIDKPFYFFLLFILASLSYLTIRNYKIKRIK